MEDEKRKTKSEMHVPIGFVAITERTRTTKRLCLLISTCYWR